MRVRQQVRDNMTRILEDRAKEMERENIRDAAIMEKVIVEVEKYLKKFKETREPMSYEMVDSLYNMMKGRDS